MGIILAGILIAVVVFFLAVWCTSDSFDGTSLMFLAIVCVIGGFFAGIGAPVSGYEEAEIVSTSQKAYKSNTISGNNVTIVEDDNNDDARLVIYVKYGKKSFWTFAAGAKKYEYVFYVPTGTIARDVSLG